MTDILKDKITLAEAVTHIHRSEVIIREWLRRELIINYVPGSKGSRMRFDKVELEAAATVIRDPDAVILHQQEIKKKVEALRAKGYLKTPQELIALKPEKGIAA